MAVIRRAVLRDRRFPEKSLATKSCALAAESKHHSPLNWFSHRPYLLLSLTSLFWAGNVVLLRYAAGRVPPMTVSWVRRIGALIVLWPFARPHFAKDWPILRAKLPLVIVLSATGFAYNNAVSNVSRGPVGLAHPTTSRQAARTLARKPSTADRSMPD
jgi:drug/metabolite transporter (DMT)-like permease